MKGPNSYDSREGTKSFLHETKHTPIKIET